MTYDETRVIPEVTDDTRRRWRQAIDQARTYQGDNSGHGVTIDELLGDLEPPDDRTPE